MHYAAIGPSKIAQDSYFALVETKPILTEVFMVFFISSIQIPE
jgi:hypothetical protein